MELSFEGLSLRVPESVYAPAEDSIMLAKAARELQGKVLEIGCGSGIASLSAARAGCEVLGVDINTAAVACAGENAARNGIRGTAFIQGDLFSPIPKSANFDVIMFNPPYLPTNENERVGGPLNHAFDGGPDGRCVLDRFLMEFDCYLKPGGTLLLVQSSLNDAEKTEDKLRALGYKITNTASQSFFFESIYLIKAEKPHLYIQPQS